MDTSFLITGAFVGIIAMILVGIPVAVSLLIGSWSLLAATGQSSGLIVIQFSSAFHHFTLIAIPLFILAAEIMMAGKLMAMIFAATNSLVGRIPGGFGLSSIMATMIFGGLSGSSAADAAAIGRIGTDGMTQYGYPKAWAAALIATSANLAVLIPPSIGLIIYGALTGTSIASLFFAGIVPGFMLALILMVYTSIKASRSGWGVNEPLQQKEFLARWLRVAPILVLPAFALFGFYSGYFTATEIASVAVLASIILGLGYRTLRSARQFVDIVVRSTLISANLFLIIGAGLVFSTVLVQYGVVQELSRMVVELGLNEIGFLILLSCILFVLGMFMDGVALNILSTPIVFPLLAPLGIDPVHYGIVLIFNIELALITPPVGLNLFVLATATETEIGQLYRAIIPFIVLLIFALLLAIFFPEISLVLPRAMGLL